MAAENIAERRRHELLAGVAEHTALRLVRQHNMEPEAAADIGNDLADWLADHYGGQSVYFVKDEGYKLNDRDRMIFERMGRGNAHDLAAELGLSFVRVYQIYKRCLTAARKDRQPQLFGDDTGLPQATENQAKAQPGDTPAP